MELNEALLVVAAIVILVAVPIYLERRLTSKGKIIAHLIATIVLSGMFTYTLIEDFNYVRLAMTFLMISVCTYGFYRRYRKYKKGISID
jgi:ABC-type iron transport system FetAB permease component